MLKDGTRGGWGSDWYCISDQALRIWTYNGASSATGALTITIPAGAYTTVLNVCATCVRDTNNPQFATFAMVRSFTNTSVVIQCFESKTTGVLLGGSIEGLELATSSLMVNVTVFGV